MNIWLQPRVHLPFYSTNGWLITVPFRCFFFVFVINFLCNSKCWHYSFHFYHALDFSDKEWGKNFWNKMLWYWQNLEISVPGTVVFHSHTPTFHSVWLSFLPQWHRSAFININSYKYGESGRPPSTDRTEKVGESFVLLHYKNYVQKSTNFFSELEG